jgi:HAD superfamily hydrolase (TIGR01509 family)
MNGPRGALIFDYDGVLADTAPLHWKSWAKMLAVYGIDFTWNDYGIHGLGVSDAQMCVSIPKAWPHIDATELLSRNAERKQLVCALSLAELPIPEETIALLARLNEYRIGLVTSSERACVEPVLRACKLFERFDALVFGEDVAKPKPSPEPYLLIRQRLGISAGIVFEDSDHGVRSALAAGLKVVKVGNPHDLAKIVCWSVNLARV